MNTYKMDMLLRQIESDRKEMEERQLNTIDIEKMRREKEERQKNRPDRKPDCLVTGWITYIIVMVAGLIFVDYITLAIFATIYFIKWRHDKIEEANGRKYDD